MAWHVSNSAGILASRFHSNSFTTLPLYASEPKAAEVKAAEVKAPSPLDREALSLEPKDSDGNTAVDLARELADPEICNLLTGENKKMEERAPPPMDDGNVRRNSVSGQNIEEFTETYEQKN